MSLTKREEYIKKTFFNNLPEKESEEIVKKISSIGESIGFIGVNVNSDSTKTEKRKHKYDVWISKEVKKNNHLIDRIIDFRLIIDWVIENKIDIFKYSFTEAFDAQMQWHQEKFQELKIKKLECPDVDEDRVVFRFSDKNHFIYLLKPKDLNFEGSAMGHCVSGGNYKSKIKNKQSILLSLRDSKNMPHVTMEIDIKSRKVVQQFGKGNKAPIPKYINMIIEFAMFSSGYKDLKNKELLKFLNLNLAI